MYVASLLIKPASKSPILLPVTYSFSKAFLNNSIAMHNLKYIYYYILV